MAKRVAVRWIKKNVAYTVVELAEVANVTEATVRRWIGDGMGVLDTNRPTLILGELALDYLSERRAKAKEPMALHEFYCLRCHKPREPLGLMADFLPTNASGGRLMALCGVCECACNRNVRADQLPGLSAILDIANRVSDQA